MRKDEQRAPIRIPKNNINGPFRYVDLGNLFAA